MGPDCIVAAGELSFGDPEAIISGVFMVAGNDPFSPTWPAFQAISGS